MDKRNFIVAGASMAALAVLTTGCTTTSGASGDPAAQRQAIDSAADSALSRLFQESAGSKDLVASARGVLIFPISFRPASLSGGPAARAPCAKAAKPPAISA